MSMKLGVALLVAFSAICDVSLGTTQAPTDSSQQGKNLTARAIAEQRNLTWRSIEEALAVQSGSAGFETARVTRAHYVGHGGGGMIYEMDVLHFAGGFRAAAARLPLLSERFGIETIWVLPPYQRYADAPYATLDYYRIDSRLGNESDAQLFVDTAHSLGMRVIFDITTAGHGCQIGGGGFDRFPAADRKITQEGELISKGMPDLCAYDFCSKPEEVTSFFKGVFLHWMTLLGIDGYRCDTASALAIPGWSYQRHCPATAINVEQKFWSEIIVAVRSKRPDAFFLAEAGDPAMYHFGFDAVYAFTLVQPGLDKMPKNSHADILVKALKNGAQYYRQLQAEIERLWEGTPVAKSALFYTSNHDLWAYTGSPQSVFGDTVSSMCAFLIVALSSQTVSIYNGQEIGSRQRLDFNNADPAFDINFKEGDSHVADFYSLVGRIFKQEASKLSYREFTEGNSNSLGLTLLPDLRQLPRLGVFLDAASEAPSRGHPDLPQTVVDLQLPTGPRCRLLAAADVVLPGGRPFIHPRPSSLTVAII